MRKSINLIQCELQKAKKSKHYYESILQLHKDTTEASALVMTVADLEESIKDFNKAATYLKILDELESIGL